MATNRHFILTNSLEIKEAGAFRDDLNRQCGLIMLPASLVAIFTWLPYIELDMHLCPDFPSFIYLRLGMSLMGMIILLFHRLSLRRPDNYLLLFLLMTYVDLSSAFIVGLSSAAPAYIGGLCIIILIHPMLPFLRGTTLFLMGFSIIVFLSVGSYSRMSFDTELQNYGLYNLLSAVLVSIIGVTILDRIRRIKFKKKILLQDAHEKLRKTSCNLSLTNEELRKANEVKSELLGLAAHDLKNPLQVIIGYTNLLKMKMKKDPKVFEKLNMINISSDKMLKLITQLLETSAIDNGKLRLNLTLVDIGELAENVISVMKPLAERKRQTIIFRADKECIVNGDQMLLQEVMDNLISNAVKFSPFDKTIYVSVDRSLSSSVICFAVRDEGPGLTLDDKCKLFEKYCRLSAKPTGGESSTGLGLSIIRDLVELHNGKIRVDGEPGKGSTFTVHLPMLT